MRGVLLLSAATVLSGAMLGCGGSSSGQVKPLTTPVLSGVAPNPVAPGGSITVDGDFLNGTFTTAFFFATTGPGSGQATAVSGSTQAVVVTVPSTLPAGTYNLYVQTTNAANNNTSPASNELPLTVN